MYKTPMRRVPRDVLVYLYRWRAGAPQLLMRRRAPDRDGPQLDALDLEIRSVFREERLITPDDVRRRRLTLEESVRRHGWPALEDGRGKVAFLLDNDPGPIRDAYLAGRPNLEGRVRFTNSLAGPPGRRVRPEQQAAPANAGVRALPWGADVEPARPARRRTRCRSQPRRPCNCKYQSSCFRRNQGYDGKRWLGGPGDEPDRVRFRCYGPGRSALARSVPLPSVRNDTEGRGRV
ncbi:MAG TPA: Ca2+-dependent phosphoinositide-specific phospholipase C [Chloroflexota bacterium]|nr:Ca2+-dependent phosphoinositide-specific phospholipase C [Chloroflexota bacterium]